MDHDYGSVADAEAAVAEPAGPVGASSGSLQSAQSEGSRLFAQLAALSAASSEAVAKEDYFDEDSATWDIDALNDETELEWPRPRKRMNTEAVDAGRDPRLPPTGTVLVRPYKGVEYQVTVLQSGFQYAGQHYASLSKIAQEITGTHWNGFLFFKLQSRAAKTKGGTA